MPDMPLVSILIPCFNAERWIGLTLDSALSQTYQNIEVIVVNDGSSDNSKAIISDYAQKDIRVKLYSKINEGPAKTRNYAFRHCHGDFIQTLDADDYISSNKIERQLKLLLAPGNGNKIAICNWGSFLADDLMDFTPAAANSNLKDFSPAEIMKRMWGESWFLPPHTYLFPRIIMEKGGLWDENITYNEDWELTARLFAVSNGIVYTPDATVYYRRTPGSLSSKPPSRKMFDDILYAMRSRAKSLLSIEDSEDSRRAIGELWYNWAWMLNIYKDYPEYLEKCLKELAALHWPAPYKAGGKFIPIIRLIGFRNALRMRRILLSFGI